MVAIGDSFGKFYKATIVYPSYAMSQLVKAETIHLRVNFGFTFQVNSNRTPTLSLTGALVNGKIVI